MSIPRRLGRLARGLVSGLGEEDRLRETLRLSRERSETLRDAFGAAWRSASEELRAAEAREREAREAEDGESEDAGRWGREAHERIAREHEARKRAAEGRNSEAQDAGRTRSYRQTAEDFIREWEERQREARASGRRSASFIPRRYSPEVIKAYERLGLDTGAPIDEVNRKRRDLVRRYHPDRFSDPDKRVRAERLTAEINASHDVIERHLLRK